MVNDPISRQFPAPPHDAMAFERDGPAWRWKAVKRWWFARRSAIPPADPDGINGDPIADRFIIPWFKTHAAHAGLEAITPSAEASAFDLAFHLWRNRERDGSGIAYQVESNILSDGKAGEGCRGKIGAEVESLYEFMFFDLRPYLSRPRVIFACALMGPWPEGFNPCMGFRARTAAYMLDSRKFCYGFKHVSSFEYAHRFLHDRIMPVPTFFDMMNTVWRFRNSLRLLGDISGDDMVMLLSWLRRQAQRLKAGLGLASLPDEELEDDPNWRRRMDQLCRDYPGHRLGILHIPEYGHGENAIRFDNFLSDERGAYHSYPLRRIPPVYKSPLSPDESCPVCGLLVPAVKEFDPAWDIHPDLAAAKEATETREPPRGSSRPSALCAPAVKPIRRSLFPEAPHRAEVFSYPRGGPAWRWKLFVGWTLQHLSPSTAKLASEPDAVKRDPVLARFALPWCKFHLGHTLITPGGLNGNEPTEDIAAFDDAFYIWHERERDPLLNAYRIEANILAGRRPGQSGRKGATVAVEALYEAMFFDVRPYLADPRVIFTRVLTEPWPESDKAIMRLRTQAMAFLCGYEECRDWYSGRCGQSAWKFLAMLRAARVFLSALRERGGITGEDIAALMFWLRRQAKKLKTRRWGELSFPDAVLAEDPRWRTLIERWLPLGLDGQLGGWRVPPVGGGEPALVDFLADHGIAGFVGGKAPAVNDFSMEQEAERRHLASCGVCGLFAAPLDAAQARQLALSIG